MKVPDAENRDGDRELPRHRVYPDAGIIFSWRPEPLESAKHRCLVVLDTNVLVIPYSVGPRTLREISRTYRSLAQQRRLAVPGQVAREFAKVRATKLGELQKQLADRRSRTVALQIGRYPLLESIPEFKEALSIEAEINELLGKYRRALGRVGDRVRQWSWTDPVAELYSDLFAERAVVDPPMDFASLEDDLRWRVEHKVPPGYKDAAKDDNGVGDLVIWRTLLWLGHERQCDILFVTGDDKADWWHRSDGTTLFPRHELVEEFRRESGGHSFYMLGFSELLDLFGAEEGVVAEVRQRERGWEPARYSNNTMTIRDGEVVVVRHGGRYGAVQAVRQTLEYSPDSVGPYPADIEYKWWYQPDAIGSFVGPRVLTGKGVAREGQPPGPNLCIGPITLVARHGCIVGGGVPAGTGTMCVPAPEAPPCRPPTACP